MSKTTTLLCRSREPSVTVPCSRRRVRWVYQLASVAIEPLRKLT